MADSTDPTEWIRYANADLILSRIVPPAGVLLEMLCCHAQQAAEKAIRAVLRARGASVKKTHGINLLVDLVVETGAPPPPLDRVEAETLTQFSVLTR